MSSLIGLASSNYLKALSCRTFGAGSTVLFGRQRWSMWKARGMSTNREANIPIVVAPKIREALEAKQAVVAIETATLSQSFFSKGNQSIVNEIEARAKEGGAMAAPIIVMKGKVYVGLTEQNLEEMSQAGVVPKLSMRDLALAIAKDKIGALTVSASIGIADLLQIPLCVTVGLGGVQRRYEESMDVSSDLTELGRTPVSVVCSGVWPSLSVSRTLEVLETAGVTTVTYGDTEHFPNVLANESGCNASTHMERSEDVAKLLHAQKALGIKAGTVIAIPPPLAESVDGAKLDRAVEQACLESEYEDQKDFELNNFLFKRTNELMAIDIESTSLALLQHNVTKAADIANQLTLLQRPL